ncbi:MAG TPA: prepilin-type N-terminal cleavage/methylation domain-containing protein [Armatimonadota bacterium]|jgi:prepilin-type N-terminal cleavage/methylation domain-containing protein/prepilin-type processing-associated H-X9-DG protein
MKTRRGFTLIELLVVIAIIAILAAILFPVFARARAKAQQSNCLSNVKQITLGFLMYASDYDDTLCPAAVTPTATQVMPNGATYASAGMGYAPWYHLINPYIKNFQLLNCPSYATNTPYTGGNQTPPGYGMNNMLSAGKRLSGINAPAECIMMGEDADDATPTADTFSYYVMDWDTRSTGDNASPPAARHNDGSNMGFCDGHAKWYKWQTIGFRDGADHAAPPAPDMWNP